MNNSCDLKLIEACHEEIEHRVNVYEKYKNPNVEEDGAGNNLQNYETPWIDPSTQESIYADPTSFETVTLKRNSKKMEKKNVVKVNKVEGDESAEGENHHDNKNKDTKISAVDEEIIEILKQTTKEDIYGPLPFHEINILTRPKETGNDLDQSPALGPHPEWRDFPIESTKEDIYGPLPFHENNILTRPKETGNDLDQISALGPHPGWRDLPIESFTTKEDIYGPNDSDDSKSTVVSDSDFQLTDFADESSNEIEKFVEEVDNSVPSITKNGLAVDEIFASDPFFKSEPDFVVEFRSEVGTGKQFFLFCIKQCIYVKQFILHYYRILVFVKTKRIFEN